MNKRLQTKIDKFLSEKREPLDGNEWAEVTDQDISDLYAIIHLLIEGKCKQYNMDTYPIQFVLINKQKEYWPCPVWSVNFDETIDDVHKMALMISSLTEKIGRYAQNKIIDEREK